MTKDKDDKKFLENPDPRLKLSSATMQGKVKTGYTPLELTDDAVYDLARHWFTMHEIADLFNVHFETINKNYKQPFLAGKKNGIMKPRFLLNKVMSDFEEAGLDFTKPDAQTNTLLRAIEIHGKLYAEPKVQKIEITNTDPTELDKKITELLMKAKPE